MLSEIRVGSIVSAFGAVNPGRADKTGALVVTSGHGEFTEACANNTVYAIDSDTVTIATANTTKGVLGTIKFINGFYNPINSGKNAAVLAAIVATISGTPAGPLFYNMFVGKQPTNSETGTIRSLLLGQSNQSAMRPHVGVVLAVLPADSTSAAVQIGVVGGPAASAVGAGMYSICDNVNGKIIVPPGVLFGLAAVGAGTSHVVQSTLVWEEIPI